MNLFSGRCLFTSLKNLSLENEIVQALKGAGFNDRNIFDINQIAAYFNYVNRIADGLGLTLEKDLL